MGQDPTSAQGEAGEPRVSSWLLQLSNLPVDEPADAGECDPKRLGAEGTLLTRVQTGYKRPLEFKDIPAVNPNRAVDPLTERVKESFKRRVEKGDKYPLLWAMHEVFFREFWLGGFCHLASTLLQVMSPFTLRFLIQFATDAYVASSRGLPAPHIGAGLGLVFGITVMQLLQSLGTNHFIYRGMLVGGMARASLISMIYEKSMVISGRAKAGGAELPDVPAAKAAEKESKKSGGKKGPPGAQSGVSADGVGWGNGRIVSPRETGLDMQRTY